VVASQAPGEAIEAAHRTQQRKSVGRDALELREADDNVLRALGIEHVQL
jgi:hypothetical protein